MNLSNLLSLSRLLIVPFIVLAMAREQNALMLALMLAGAATDWLDGYFARKLNQVSDLGKILDPLADKIGLDAIVIGLWLWRGFPWWAVTLVIGRDILILAGGLFIIGNKRRVPVSNMPGKVAVCVLAGAVVCYAMRWQPWGWWILLGALALAAVSGIGYLRIALRKGEPCSVSRNP